MCNISIIILNYYESFLFCSFVISFSFFKFENDTNDIEQAYHKSSNNDKELETLLDDKDVTYECVEGAYLAKHTNERAGFKLASYCL